MLHCRELCLTSDQSRCHQLLKEFRREQVAHPGLGLRPYVERRLYDLQKCCIRLNREVEPCCQRRFVIGEQSAACKVPGTYDDIRVLRGLEQIHLGMEGVRPIVAVDINLTVRCRIQQIAQGFPRRAEQIDPCGKSYCPLITEIEKGLTNVLRP